VRFDGFGVPHVFAGSDEDAWRAVGYLQARDRVWPMELYRRAASGRPSELLMSDGRDDEAFASSGRGRA
jgi:penicillin amidase